MLRNRGPGQRGPMECYGPTQQCRRGRCVTVAAGGSQPTAEANGRTWNFNYRLLFSLLTGADDKYEWGQAYSPGPV